MCSLNVFLIIRSLSLLFSILQSANRFRGCSGGSKGVQKADQKRFRRSPEPAEPVQPVQEVFSRFRTSSAGSGGAQERFMGCSGKRFRRRSGVFGPGSGASSRALCPVRGRLGRTSAYTYHKCKILKDNSLGSNDAPRVVRAK